MGIIKLSMEARAGSCVAQSIQAACYLERIDVEIDYARAVELYRQLPSRAPPAQQAIRRACMPRKLGLSKDLPTASSLYKKAAEAGDLFAQVELGRMHSREENSPSIWLQHWNGISSAAAQEKMSDDCEEFLEAKAYIANFSNLES
jgi:TPR repeat protein